MKERGGNGEGLAIQIPIIIKPYNKNQTGIGEPKRTNRKFSYVGKYGNISNWVKGQTF